VANYTPKEKKPVLNRESIQSDLKKSLKQPSLLRFTLFVIFVLMTAFWFGILFWLLTANMLPAVSIFYWILFVFYTGLPALLLFILWIMTEGEIRARLGKFYIDRDTIEHKVFSEPIRVYRRRSGYADKKYRYASAVYFNKYGRYEVNYDTVTVYGEYDSRYENRMNKRLDEYELEKDYIVVTFGNRRPNIIAVYDPDDYDVQI
jgi:hypothetical protein